MSRIICGSDQYTIGGEFDDTIALHFKIEGLPESVEVNGELLQKKSKFHACLISHYILRERFDIKIANFAEKVTQEFCEYIQERPIELVGLRDEFRYVEKGDKRSVIVMCEMRNLDEFFDNIKQKFMIQLDYQPTHITLYTLGLDQGIFLVDKQDMRDLTTVIACPFEGGVDSIVITAE